MHSLPLEMHEFHIKVNFLGNLIKTITQTITKKNEYFKPESNCEFQSDFRNFCFNVFNLCNRCPGHHKDYNWKSKQKSKKINIMLLWIRKLGRNRNFAKTISWEQFAIGWEHFKQTKPIFRRWVLYQPCQSNAVHC